MLLLAAFDPVAQQFGAAVVDPRQLAAIDRDRLVARDGAQRIFQLGKLDEGRRARPADARPLFIVRMIHLEPQARSEEHTSELQSLMRISYAVFCLIKTKQC